MAQAVPGRPTSTTGRGNPFRALAGSDTTYYLWMLLGLELLATYALRQWSRHHHGG